MLGKTEMWYIIDTKPMATILSGLVRDIDAAEYFRRVADGTLQDIVACHHSAPGDVFFLPPGRVHAAGAGNFLVEVQQASDITYRIDDYRRRDSQGKLRELHTDLAADAIDFRCHPFCKTVPQPGRPRQPTSSTLCRILPRAQRKRRRHAHHSQHRRLVHGAHSASTAKARPP